MFDRLTKIKMFKRCVCDDVVNVNGLVITNKTEH